MTKLREVAHQHRLNARVVVPTGARRPPRRWPGLRSLVACLALLLPGSALANGIILAGDSKGLHVDGWAGFNDIGLLLNFMSSLTLAALLSLVVGWSPRHLRYLRRMTGAATPMVMVTYGVIGAVIGTIVVHYGMGVGLVVFGIGGLMRFRSNLGTPESTGRVILATVIGLCAGLQLPHVAVTVTLFIFGVLLLFGRVISFRFVVKGLDPKGLEAAAASHRGVLESAGCHVVGEKKSFLKGQVAFLCRAPSDLDPDKVVRRMESDVPDALRGAVDWDIG